MQDLSLHLLDIIENSTRAGASLIKISIDADEKKDVLKFKIEDNGSGMDADTLNNALNPFYTSKESREKKVGLGIPLFMQNAELCEGSFHVTSKLGKGTDLEAIFKKSHIDRMPVGSLADTIIGSLIGHAETDFYLKITHNTRDEVFEYEFDTRVLKEELGDIPLTYPDVIQYIMEDVNNGIKNTKMGEI
ncbi:ATP-binding protein [bacterium]|nr:ATP-binding protein [bacterium]